MYSRWVKSVRTITTLEKCDICHRFVMISHNNLALCTQSERRHCHYIKTEENRRNKLRNLERDVQVP
jgi:hypothetical protein